MKTPKKTRRKFRRQGTFHVYIVVCADGTYYTGSTGDLQKRVESHNKGRGAKYLRGKLPVKVVFARGYRYYKHALMAERKIKALTRRQKEALIGN
ncbi:MAG: GIY-YIG nuclease family protein [Candidatus Omnitrophica bacterium]|nr:GIY-YIG nuclease family protein [Candidatus Omnitrophota bacterium]